MEFSNYIKLFFGELGRRRYSSGFIFLSIFLISIITAFNLKDDYKTTALLKYSEEDANNNLNTASPLGGIVSLGGINLNSGTTDPIDYSIEIIKSRDFLRNLLEFPNIRENLVASDYYDFNEQKIIYKSSIYDEDNAKWIRSQSKFKDVVPGYLEVHKDHYIKNLTLVKNRATGFLSISFNHSSPYFAKDFLDLIINEVNRIVREDDQSNSEKKLDFLMERSSKTLNNEVKQALGQLIENELKKIAYSSTKVDYMLEVIDPPYVSDKPEFPNRLLIIVLGMFVGLISVILNIHIPLYLRREM